MSRVEKIFDKLEKKILQRKEELSKIGASVKFDLSGPEGGKWIVDLNKNSLGVREGNDDANCTFLSTDENFIKLIKRELKPESAILTGKVKLSGDIMLAMKIANLFK